MTDENVLKEFSLDEEQAEYFDEVVLRLDKVILGRIDGDDLEPGTYELRRVDDE